MPVTSMLPRWPSPLMALLLAAVLSAPTLGCDDDTTDTRPVDVSAQDTGLDTTDPDPFDTVELDALEPGARVFNTPGITGGNTFACSTCHALDEPAGDGIRRVGHRLGDAVLRPHYKNGQLDSLLAAVNTCATEWMVGSAWQADDPDWVALEAFLRDQAPADAVASPPVTLQVVVPPDDLSGGDRNRGHDLFNTSCSACHGLDAAGTNRGPALVGADLEASYIARRVRTSGLIDSDVYDGLTGGIMPFWSADRLSDDELRDLIAWTVEIGQPDVPPMDPDPDMTDVSDAPQDTVDTADTLAMQDTSSGCTHNHPRVGQSVALTGHFHDVAGTAAVVDDCTVVIEDFVYDGQGLDVRWYAGVGGDFHNGFAVSGDIFGQPYSGDDFVITLPDGTTHDDYDGLSVWCVDVGVSFGDLTFSAP